MSSSYLPTTLLLIRVNHSYFIIIFSLAPMKGLPSRPEDNRRLNRYSHTTLVGKPSTQRREGGIKVINYHYLLVISYYVFSRIEL